MTDDFPPLTRVQRIRRWWKALLWRDFMASRVVVMHTQALHYGDPEWDGAPRHLNRGEIARHTYEMVDILLDEAVRPDIEWRLRDVPPRRSAAECAAECGGYVYTGEDDAAVTETKDA